jgi:toxin-antitoxin system PIN domain toxin
VIVPDLNLLLYAHNDGALRHDSARRWWEDLVNGSVIVGLPWVVSTGFIRLLTHPKVLSHPATPSEAVDFVREWFNFPHIMPINPGADHLTILRRNLVAAGVGGNLTTDSHIAALALEYQAEVHTNDNDFRRFPGLRWRNPL